MKVAKARLQAAKKSECQAETTQANTVVMFLQHCLPTFLHDNQINEEDRRSSFWYESRFSRWKKIRMSATLRFLISNLSLAANFQVYASIKGEEWKVKDCLRAYPQNGLDLLFNVNPTTE